MRKCAYCGTQTNDGRCHKCGGPATEDRQEESHYSSPFWLNGLFVWPEWWGLLDQRVRYHFYEGPELVEVLEFSKEAILRQFPELAQGYDTTTWLWDLFCVAHYGEKRVYYGKFPESRRLKMTIEREPGPEGQNDDLLARVA